MGLIIGKIDEGSYVNGTEWIVWMQVVANDATVSAHRVARRVSRPVNNGHMVMILGAS